MTTQGGVKGQRIITDPEILCGKPVIRGTRISVELLLGWMASGWSEQDILESYPGLTQENLLACITYGANDA